MPNFIDLTGQRFGRWEALGQAQRHYTKSGRPIVMWRCRCDCGTVRDVDGLSLRSGKSVSCGCYRADNSREMMVKHNIENAKYDGPYNHRLYNSWYGMIERCYNKKHKSYHNYGGRGITVCDEWRKSYLSFREWALSNGYKDYLTVDRIDVNGNYEPSNCRWATTKEQGNNRRTNHMVEANGEVHTLTQWADIFGVRLDRVQYYVKRGYSGERFFKKMMSLSKNRG